LQGTKIVRADVADLTAADIGLAPDGELDLVAGGPPCQPFSSAGAQRGLDDPRGVLFEHFARLVGELRPKMFLFENVRGLITARGPSGRPGEALDLVRAAFERAGYSTRCALLNAADFGCPQRRVRLFVIGSRISVLPMFPAPTHADAENVFGLPPWRTLGELLATLPPAAADEIVRPSEALEAQLAGLPVGSGLKSAGVRETTRPGGHWGYRQGTFIADPSKPARTVTASSTQDWVRLADGSVRRLTTSECAALQGFPTEWHFVGNRATQYRQIGNAVPVTFGEVIGRALADVACSCRRQGCTEERPPSASLPSKFLDYVNYTARDEARNGSSRPRSKMKVLA
jgi:DNA (cytosine-5)-methyltransferase 1